LFKGTPRAVPDTLYGQPGPLVILSAHLSSFPVCTAPHTRSTCAPMGQSRRSNCVGAHASSHPRAQDRTRASFLLWRSWMGAMPAELRRPLHLGRPPASTAPQGAQTLALRSHYIRRPLGFFPKAAATSCSHPLGFSPSASPRNRGKRSKGRSRGKGERRAEHHRVIAIQGQPDVVILEPLHPAGPRPHRQGQRHRSTTSQQGVP
jgi:hypothetical protein